MPPLVVGQKKKNNDVTFYDLSAPPQVKKGESWVFFREAMINSLFLAPPATQLSCNQCGEEKKGIGRTMRHFRAFFPCLPCDIFAYFFLPSAKKKKRKKTFGRAETFL